MLYGILTNWVLYSGRNFGTTHMGANAILTNWVLYSGRNTIADLHERHAAKEKEAVQRFARVSTKLRDQLADAPLKCLKGDE